jgi:anti-anti-sigma factor
VSTGVSGSAMRRAATSGIRVSPRDPLPLEPASEEQVSPKRGRHPLRVRHDTLAQSATATTRQLVATAFTSNLMFGPADESATLEPPPMNPPPPPTTRFPAGQAATTPFGEVELSAELAFTRSNSLTPGAPVFGRFRRAIERRVPWTAEDAARALPNLPLEDALRLAQLYAERGSPKYEKAALRWLERYLAEGLAPAPTLRGCHARARAPRRVERCDLAPSRAVLSRERCLLDGRPVRPRGRDALVFPRLACATFGVRAGRYISRAARYDRHSIGRTVLEPNLEDIQVERPADGTSVVVFSGEHDLATKHEVTELLHSLVASDRLVIADFSEAVFVDSSILAVLLGVNRHASELGKVFRLQLGTAAIVRRAFEISGVFDVIEHLSTREEALLRGGE